ncbi:MAG: SDR family oxidoreductase [Candidatus Heimdallarchaeota archaeon]
MNYICPDLIKTWEELELLDPSGRTPEKIERYIRVEVPLDRIGQPIDIAETVVVLVSDAARYIVEGRFSRRWRNVRFSSEARCPLRLRIGLGNRI